MTLRRGARVVCPRQIEASTKGHRKKQNSHKKNYDTLQKTIVLTETERIAMFLVTHPAIYPVILYFPA